MVNDPFADVEEKLSWAITIDSPEWRAFLKMKADADALLAMVRLAEKMLPKINSPHNIDELDFRMAHAALPERLK